ncbi:hypothetical protein ACI8AK_05365 [Geodermatophilus sp. SYSU D00867]
MSESVTGERPSGAASADASGVSTATSVVRPDAAGAAVTSGPPPQSFVYAIGRVEPRFPTLGVEKEFAQVISRTDGAGQTDREMLQRTLTDPGNRYLARHLCWTLLIEGLETYVLIPRDGTDLDLLIETVRTGSDRGDMDVVVGRRGPIAPPDLCGGLAVPVVVLDQLWSFTRDSLLEAIPRAGDQDDERFTVAAGELLDRVMQLADNAGATSAHRALNYLAVRYPAIYVRTAEAFNENQSLSAVDVRPSRLAGVRDIVDVIFRYTHRRTDVTESFFVRVDVTEEFPFLVSRLAPFYDR